MSSARSVSWNESYIDWAKALLSDSFSAFHINRGSLVVVSFTERVHLTKGNAIRFFCNLSFQSLNLAYQPLNLYIAHSLELFCVTHSRLVGTSWDCNENQMRSIAIRFFGTVEIFCIEYVDHLCLLTCRPSSTWQVYLFCMRAFSVYIMNHDVNVHSNQCQCKNNEHSIYPDSNPWSLKSGIVSLMVKIFIEHDLAIRFLGSHFFLSHSQTIRFGNLMISISVEQNVEFDWTEVFSWDSLEVSIGNHSRLCR